MKMVAHVSSNTPSERYPVKLGFEPRKVLVEVRIGRRLLRNESCRLQIFFFALEYPKKTIISETEGALDGTWAKIMNY